MSRAVIIGAGPAGLTAAYELSKLGVRSTVIEADRQVGGLFARTVEYRGYRFDIGGHRFFTKVPLIRQRWREILGGDFLVRPRLSRIYYGGHFFDYPLKAANALVGLGPIEASRVCLSYAKAKLRRPGEEATFAQWVSNRFGERLYEVFFKNYTEKVWGIPCTEISADWAAQRIKNLSLTEALRSAMFSKGRTRDGQVIATLIDQFNYPRYGPGMMWERCESLLAGQGHETVHDVRIERIRHHQGRVECVYGRTSSGQLLEFAGDHFVSTMPLRELIHALDPSPPNEVLQSANRLRYRDYLTVILILNRESVFSDNWIYVHASEVKMARVQNYKNWSPDMVPDPSRTSLGLEYFLWETDQEWSWSRERWLEMGVRECAQIGLIDSSEVEDGTVVRMKKAYPIYDGSYQDSLVVVRRYLEAFNNLQSVGRNGQHRYNNQDHSMLTAIYAARNIMGEKYDVWSVNVDSEYHEEEAATDEAASDRLTALQVSPDAAEVPLSPERMIEAAFARLDAVALGTAVGLVAGLGIFLATAVLLLKGGTVVGPTLSLLRHYLRGFEATWTGALVGLLEVGAGGFVVGYLVAWLTNVGIKAYASLIKRRADARERRDLLDRV